MKDKNERKKRNIFDYMFLFVIACIIAVLVISSFVLAKYATGSSGIGVTNIDYYSVSAELYDETPTQVEQFNISVGESGKTCTLKLINAGSSVNYTVTLTNETKNLPLKLTLNDTSDVAVNNYVSISSSTPLTSTTQSVEITIKISIVENSEYKNLYREIDRVSVKVMFTQAETSS